MPASYCGLFGLRPTHGRIPLSGARPLAPSYDTVGWFARDAPLLRKTGEVLLSRFDAAGRQKLPGSCGCGATPRWLVGRDAFELADPEAARAIYDVLSGGAGAGEGAGKEGVKEGVAALLGAPREVEVGRVEGEEGLSGFAAWMGAFRVTQVGGSNGWKGVREGGLVWWEQPMDGAMQVDDNGRV